jgi:uncharacterized phage-associated protein
MAVSAHDVASEVRRRLRAVGTLKLHKLLYFMQCCHLATRAEPLVREEMRAWAKGPVVAELWADEKHQRPRPARMALTTEQLATIDYVLDRYGKLSGEDLVRLTHGEGPWRDVSERDDGDDVITHEAMRAWFERDEQILALAAFDADLRARADLHDFGGDFLTPQRLAIIDDVLAGGGATTAGAAR